VIMAIIRSIPDSSEWHSTIESLKTLDESSLTLEKVKRRLLERHVEVGKGSNRVASAGSNGAFSVGDGVKCFACKKAGHIVKYCDDDAAKQAYFDSRKKKDVGRNGKGGNYALNASSHYAFTVNDHKTQQDSAWYKDAGAACHYTHQREVFADYKLVNESVYLADDTRLKVIGKGSVWFRDATGNVVKISDVHHCPGMAVNLLSTAQLDKRGVEEVCKNGQTTFKVDGVDVMTATRQGNRWIMDWNPIVMPNERMEQRAHGRVSRQRNRVSYAQVVASNGGGGKVKCGGLNGDSSMVAWSQQHGKVGNLPASMCDSNGRNGPPREWWRNSRNYVLFVGPRERNVVESLYVSLDGVSDVVEC